MADGVRHRGDQVGERLAGPGPRLHGEMLPRPDRAPDRLGHLVLPGPGAPPDAVHRRGQQDRHRGRRRAGIQRRLVHVWNATAPPGRPAGSARGAALAEPLSFRLPAATPPPYAALTPATTRPRRWQYSGLDIPGSGRPLADRRAG